MIDSYDYVIIGGGSAGCIVAMRLAEQRGARILLLEAGPSKATLNSRIPAAFPKLYKSTIDWGYQTEAEPNCDNRSLFWPRGKVMGGCHAINAMLYVRGNRLDYDAWRNAGCAGWGYDDVLPYFLKTERNARSDSAFHNSQGVLHVSNLRVPYPVSRAICSAASEARIPANDDFNGERQDGFGTYQVTQKNGSRFTVADALRESCRTSNACTIVCGAVATKIQVNGNRAVGVQYLHNGTEHLAKAEKEIILSGGAINSPQLLMLSGIGPADHLKALGISVIVNLPGVGKNLQDHPVAGVLYTSTRKDTLDSAESFGNLIRYLFWKTGPFTSSIAEVGGFVRTDPALPAPDLQFHCAPGFFKNHGFTKLKGNGFTIGPTLLTPRSRGRVELRSTNPSDPPRIFANYFAAREDLEILIKGIRLARNIAHQPALKPYVKGELFPGPDAQSDGDLESYIRSTAETLYHPVGTCAMGTDEDAVVDPKLCVHGIEGLRVIDASVMPVITRGNTNAPTIMIAEKGADLIKNA